ncbi:MAG: UvrD-helicase domain-containing protein, partial [Candidatus Micrarchaeia archaeon]
MEKTLLNKEKQDILNYEGNTLVIANPGTGKTLLLAHKYAHLIEKGEKPEDILCLTFTKKAKSEMEERILKVLKQKNIDININNLNVFNFHSYALNYLEEDEVVSSNFLRFFIYKYFKDNEILNYGDDYLLDTIVPKMENLIRYLKSFGIKPNNINLKELQLNLTEYGKLSKEEMDNFAEYFIKTYEFYETEKTNLDYSDMLLEFKSIKNKPKFKHVLIDELQDVNIIEADIAFESGETF